MPLLLPAALLVIPYADLLLAVVRRTRAGHSPFSPDRKHLHHRLLDIGHSQRASVLIMYLWAAVFSGIVVWLSIRGPAARGANHHGQPVLVFVAITAAAVVALLLIAMPKLRWWEGRSRRSRATSEGNGDAPQPAAVVAASANGLGAAATGARPPDDAAAARAEAELVSVTAAQPLPAPVVTGQSARPAGSGSPPRSVVGAVPPSLANSPLEYPFPFESPSGSQPKPAEAQPAGSDDAEPGQEGSA